MPKFVSGSSGHIYAPDKLTKSKDDDDGEELALLAAGNVNENKDIFNEKPAAINKKGTREKQKTSLDLFKEELRRLNEERDNQKKNASTSPKSSTSSAGGSRQPTQKSSHHYQPVPVPLKPDPRCPTQLTLQVNLNPKDKDASMSGSFDTGDPTTTNVYLGNLNPTVNENDLCDIFGKFGPLASIKIMWPRTDEERARNRNSGFVAYMSRVDAERAVKALHGLDFRGYDMKLGWGKAVPLPQNPVYIPPELKKILEPPPQSGLPFNAQLHPSDKERGYLVPIPLPMPLPPGFESHLDSTPELVVMKKTYEEFIEVYKRATIKVVIPQDLAVLDRIHKTIDFVIRGGPIFEANLIAQENNNPTYSFLIDNQSHEHVYYRWKLYSLLNGDDPYKWRTEEFRMFENGPIWKPPPLNPFAEGMPLELIEKTTGINKDLFSASNTNPAPIHKPLFSEGSLKILGIHETRTQGKLGPMKREMLGDILRNLNPTKANIGSAMMFCINHADAAQEIIDCIYESLCLLETPFHRKIARLYLVSDILHNCSAAVTNASYYRTGFRPRLESMFEHLREYLVNMEDRYKADKFKQRSLSVLGAWKEWTLYEDEFVLALSNILLGLRSSSCNTTDSGKSHTKSESMVDEVAASQVPKTCEDDLDGEPLDKNLLIKCLEAKGLSLRWYQTLELSDAEDDGEEDNCTESMGSDSPSINRDGKTDKQTNFKLSKWETVDPSKVAEEAVSVSKWMAEKSGESNNLPADGMVKICSDDDKYPREHVSGLVKSPKRGQELDTTTPSSECKKFKKDEAQGEH